VRSKSFHRFKQNALRPVFAGLTITRCDVFDLCRLIREFDQATPILFFFAAAYEAAAYEADKKRGLEAGANAYVMKALFRWTARNYQAVSL